MNLQELFKAVGKQIFVKYYYYFKDSRNYSVSDIVDIIEEDYTEKSKRSRTGHARMIFNNSWNIEALKIISNSNVPIETIHECKKILAEELANINKTESKNKISNEFLKKLLSKNNIEYKSLKNSFYEINLSDNKYLLKCRTYNNNYTFVTKSEIPELSDNVLIALVEWQNEQPISLYLIPISEWNTGKWNILKDRDYEGLKSEPEWGIDINQNNKYELNHFQFSKFINTFREKENKKIIEEIEHSEEKETEKQALIKVRLGHSKLREDIIKIKGECEICGLSHNKLLIASHIKPWAKSDNFEKLDNANILLLCSMHDALFDKGLISFDDNGKILISKELNEEEQALVNINEDSCISIVSDKQKEYLKYHRENIFIK